MTDTQNILRILGWSDDLIKVVEDSDSWPQFESPSYETPDQTSDIVEHLMIDPSRSHYATTLTATVGDSRLQLY